MRAALRSASDEEIIRQIYAAMPERSRWESLFPLLKKSFDTTYSTIVLRTRPGSSSRVAEIDIDFREWRRAYETHYCRLAPASCFDAPSFAPGRVFTDAGYRDYSAYLNGELYNDFYRPLNAEHMAFLCVENSPRRQIGLVLRKSRHVGPFDACHVRRLKRLATHIANRELILSRLDTARFERVCFKHVLERIRVCSFVVDPSCRILYVTAEGEEVLRDGALMVVQSDGLCVRDARMQSQFRIAVRDCTKSLDLPEKAACRGLRVQSAEGAGATTIWVSATSWTNPSGMNEPAALVLIGARPRRVNEIAGWLAQEYGLTPAESRVATGLCFGRQPNDYARDARLSLETVRTLLKRAMQKTDTHSQAQLVSLVFRNQSVVKSPG